MKIWAWAATVGSVVALFACGGSGGSSTTTAGTGGSGAGTSMTVSSTSGNPVTTSTGTGAGGSASCGSATFSSDATCESCAETNCCSELLACDTGTACDDLFTCLQGCTDQACQMQCAMDHMDGVSDAQALLDCATGMNGNCKMECSTGVICDSGLQIKSNPPCGDCLGQMCCTEYENCTKDMGTPSCLDCVTGKATTGCDMNMAVMAVETCRTSKCSDSCGAPICDSGLSTGNGKCDMCLGTSCCMQIDACKADTNCLNNCLMTGMPASSCSSDMKYQAVKTCWNTNCAGMTACGGML